MRKRKLIVNKGSGKFSIGEIVYPKHNTALKLKIVRRLGIGYFCVTTKRKNKVEMMFREDDLISKWQIPFFSSK